MENFKNLRDSLNSILDRSPFFKKGGEDSPISGYIVYFFELKSKDRLHHFAISTTYDEIFAEKNDINLVFVRKPFSNHISIYDEKIIYFLKNSTSDFKHITIEIPSILNIFSFLTYKILRNYEISL